jgi:hypothetical protein
MATFRIVCVETLYPHRHITHVGTGSDPAAADSRWTVLEVRESIRAGNRFYTYSPSTGRTADVEPYDYWTGSYWINTIRSSPDAVADNNLDNLRVCSWRN